MILSILAKPNTPGAAQQWDTTLVLGFQLANNKTVGQRQAMKSIAGGYSKFLSKFLEFLNCVSFAEFKNRWLISWALHAELLEIRGVNHASEWE